MVKNLVLSISCLFLFAKSNLWSQTVSVTISGLRPGDSCHVTIQQSEEFFFIQSVKSGLDSSGIAVFKDIPKGLSYQNTCTVYTDTVNITIYPKPEIPLLKFLDSAITVSNSAVNNWRINGVLLALNHAGSLLIQKNGTYQAQAVSSNGCKSDWSLPIEVNLTANKEQSKISNIITVYPNPAGHIIHLTADFSLNGYSYEILGIGNQLLETGTIPDDQTIDQVKYYFLRNSSLLLGAFRV